jgi:hypothetical protein
MPFLHFDAHGFCTSIWFYDFLTNPIEISWYWKFVMGLKDLVNQKKKGIFSSIFKFVFSSFIKKIFSYVFW